MKKGKIPQKKTSRYKPLPGPWKLPIIGSMHHFRGSKEGPAHALRNLANIYGPLMHLQLGEISSLIVSSAEAAKEIMTTHDQNFANRAMVSSMKYHTYGFKNLALAPYGAYWRQARKLCVLELLTAKRVESFRSIREEEVSSLLQSIAVSANIPVNLTSKIFSLTTNVIARAAFGVRNKHQDKFLSITKELLENSIGFKLEHCFPSSRLLSFISGLEFKLKEFHRQLDHIFSDIIDEHRLKGTISSTDTQDSHIDLVDILLKFQKDGNLEVPITNDHVKALIMDMFVAGSDTSATVIIWAMAELMRNPDVMRKVQAEVRDAVGENAQVHEADLQQLNYLKAVIKETLRLHPPLPLLLPKESTEKCEIMGYEIPARIRVFINVWAIGRDAKYWGDDAEKFKPERFLDTAMDFKGVNFEFLPLGAGRRICPGITFGIANVELPLTHLLYYFNWELPNGMKPDDLSMAEEVAAVVRRKLDLYLTAIPYYPLVN
ncbi:desmethyl-deoxy-podophyllotoxin synthase-like [Aristolochia californica]|uniref:desmethyl-deoxy-podophyllotoxin synthase-like n=1 Tax=Aristolochia californica TaxID=171875 RepID=UPI0035E2615E